MPRILFSVLVGFVLTFQSVFPAPIGGVNRAPEAIYMLFHPRFEGETSQLQLVNVGTAPTTTVSILFYESPIDTNPTVQSLPNVAPGGALTLSANNLNLSSNGEYSFIVAADQPLESLVTLAYAQGSRVNYGVYPGVPAAGNRLYLAAVLKGYAGWNSTLYVQNVGTSTNLATLSVGGTSVSTYTIQPGAYAAIDAQSLAGLPVNSTVMIEGSGPLTAVMESLLTNPPADRQFYTVSMPMEFQESATLYFPRLYRSNPAACGTRTSGIQLYNPNGEANSLDIDFYTPAGALVHTHTLMLPARASGMVNLAPLPLPAGESVLSVGIRHLTPLAAATLDSLAVENCPAYSYRPGGANGAVTTLAARVSRKTETTGMRFSVLSVQNISGAQPVEAVITFLNPLGQAVFTHVVNVPATGLRQVSTELMNLLPADFQGSARITAPGPVTVQVDEYIPPPPPTEAPDLSVQAEFIERSQVNGAWSYLYSAVVENVGNALAENATLEVVFPPGMAFEWSLPSSGGPTITLGPLSEGGSQVVQVSGVTNQPTGVSGVTVFTASTPGEIALGNNAASVLHTAGAPAPIILAAGQKQETCSSQVTIRGSALPGATVTLYEDDTEIQTVTAQLDGSWAAVVSLGAGMHNLRAKAAVGTEISQYSAAVIFRIIPDLLLDPSTLRTNGIHASPGAQHGWNLFARTGVVYTVEVGVCPCAAPPQVSLDLPSGTVALSDPEGDGTYSGTVSFANTDAAQTSATLTASCEGVGSTTSTGLFHLIIDPDGVVFDVDQGLATPIQGVTTTAWVLDEPTKSKMVWPAALYENQINPQVTGADGYYAYFTPPGRYQISVEGLPQYQSYLSPVVEVITEPVHLNIPLTVFPAEPVDQVITIGAAGFQPATVTIPVDSQIQWINQELTVQRTLSTFDPESHRQGWDSGLLEYGETYTRRFSVPGVYQYSDPVTGMVGVVMVTTAIYLPMLIYQ